MSPFHIASIGELLPLVGQSESRHPLLYVSRVEELRLPREAPLDFSFGFYLIGLLRNLSGEVSCGRMPYDFSQHIPNPNWRPKSLFDL